MNHLRELLEQAKSGTLHAPRSSGISVADLNDAGDWCQTQGEQAACFWLGDVASMVELTVIDDLCRLPFPTCWFEAQFYAASHDAVTCAGLLIHQLEDGRCGGQVWVRGSQRAEWSYFGSVFGDTFAAPTASAATREMAEVVGLTGRAAQAFLSALHCSNVRRQEHTPDAKLQKARAKRGKAPLFSYWTLQLDGKSERGENQGGTHASPRVHLRRGHPRQYAPGKWTWVQAHAVGNRAAGIVDKDYRAGPGLGGSAR